MRTAFASVLVLLLATEATAQVRPAPLRQPEYGEFTSKINGREYVTWVALLATPEGAGVQ
jgi:hypothetical protein